ncbi:MAG: hypothetical protein IJH41_07345 [Eubacterium sp.]|nr:hypothetical protein [Eubacterium sp.]
MKGNWCWRLLAAVICVSVLIVCSFGAVFADEEAPAAGGGDGGGEVVAEEPSDSSDITMVEGEVLGGFGGRGTVYKPDDPSIAWVDSDGNLNAMKEGKTTIRVTSGGGDVSSFEVTVEDYTDGSEVVGRLKLLARYNDSMQFYDGHSYLLFTSYQDGVDIAVDDLYGGYEISDQYYSDIREDISSGSNHTGSDTDDYFTFVDGMNKVTLDRGEIVTIGMYRGFDLSVPDVALKMLTESTMWKELSKEGKTKAVKALFEYLDKGRITEDEAIAGLIGIFREAGVDYEEWLDGVADGGVCFNRELYNQKLEWDQFENVTYEMDITRNQLSMLTAYLNGNLDKFNLAKNSCATVALRAWNAAIGTRNGEKTSYWLSAEGEGIYSIFDAPKGVRDAIRNRLPGYYLNNSEGVAEPYAGFRDDTGWVYVSAPEPVDLPDDPDEPDAQEGAVLWSIVQKDTWLDADAEIYCYDGETRKDLGKREEVAEGTRIYIKPVIKSDDFDSVLEGMTFGGEAVGADNWDEDEGAYAVTMPDKFTRLKVVFRYGTAESKANSPVQIKAGDTMDAADYVDLRIGNDQKQSDGVKWYVVMDDESMLDLSDDGRVLTAKKAGRALVWGGALSNENVGVLYQVDAFEGFNDMPKVIFDDESEDFRVVTETAPLVKEVLPYSGFRVKKGTEVTVEPTQSESKVISGIRCGGKKVPSGEAITVDGDSEIKVSFREAHVNGMPETVRLAAKGDTYKLDASVKYTGIYSLLPVYDPAVSFISSDPLVSVDDTGLITVAGDIPEGGRSVTVTAYAGSSNYKVYDECRVIVGDYKGADIVGKITIHGRPVSKDESTPHGCLTFQTYEDLDLNVSYYRYYKPDDRYMALMEDYERNPEKYSSDPALYNNNELGLEDRESYFNDIYRGSRSEPDAVSLKAGESISLSNYSFDETNFITVLEAVENGDIKDSESAKKLVKQMYLYMNGEEIDGEEAFDGVVETLVQAYIMARFTGYNPVNGESEGGLVINREMFNQFRRNDSQMPNYYYQIEITRDELAAFQQYLADPASNTYSLFTMNCGTGVVNLWNTTLSDQPKLQLKSNLTGFTVDPESLSMELASLLNKPGLPGHGGQNFYPRTVPYLDPPAPAEKKASKISRITPAKKTIKAGKSFKLKAKVKAGNGKVTFKKTKGVKKITVSKTGRVKIRKGLKKGTYKIKVRATIAATSKYKKAVKNATIRIKVK